MNTTSHRQSLGGRTTSKRTAGKVRQQVVALQAECYYGLESGPENGAGATTNEAGQSQPVLTRYLRCRAVLPLEVPLQNASRVIAMLKCFRKVHPAGRGSATPMVETIFSRFTRIWPAGSSGDESAPASPISNALVVHDSTSVVDFTIVLPPDLPQSIKIAGGAIYYTMQIQANLRHPTDVSTEAAIYSPELTVEVPAPEEAYSASRMPKRITNGIVGQAQDHYGILITPDISLHVSVPREISYSKRQHSVFKIHIKLMPHPPEAKLPGIAKLEWKLTQRTNLGSVQMDGNHSSKRIGVSKADIATGQIFLPSVKGGASAEEAMSGSRKDQYLYIALPEDSPALLPMYDGNRYLEILHTLEIELFPASDAQTARMSSHNFTKSAASFFSKTFSRSSRRSGDAGNGGAGGGGGGGYGGGGGSGKLPWRADIPIKLYFDPAEISKRASLNGTALSKSNLERLAITS